MSAEDKLKKKSLLGRFHLEGFSELELAISTRNFESILWAVSLILFYLVSIYCTVLQLTSFFSIKIIVTPTESSAQALEFPWVAVCHTGNFNSSYLKENIRIPTSMVARLGMNEKSILAEFARYLNLFTPMNYVGEFSDQLWNAMTEIFKENFKDVQFSDFVLDAGHRGERVFKKCEYGGKRYPCTQVQIIIDSPSCYMLLTKGIKKLSELQDLAVLRKGFKFEMHLNMQHTFDEWNDDVDYKIDQLGVRLMLGNNPTPFSIQTMFPGNSHAVISYTKTRTDLLSDCYSDERTAPRKHLLGEFYSDTLCLTEGAETVAFEMCHCHFVAGDYFPRNDLVCTPEIMRNCVRKKVVAADYDDVANQNVSDFWKHLCKPICSFVKYDATVSFYSLENEKSNQTVKNKFTITYDEKRLIEWTEQKPPVFDTLLSNIGGIWGVYTGASVIAIVHAVCILIFACFQQVTNRFLRPFIGNRLLLPFSNFSQRQSFRHITTRRNIRVEPMKP